MEPDKHPFTLRLRKFTRRFSHFQWLHKAPANEREDDPSNDDIRQLENEEHLRHERKPKDIQQRKPVVWLEQKQEVEDEQLLENRQRPGSEQQYSLQTLLPNNLSHEQFQINLSKYPSYIRDVYQRAERERFDGIPNKLKLQKEPYIEKNDLIYLDQWMQKRGTPLDKGKHLQNKARIEQNTNENIRRVTLKAFREYKNNREVVAAMDILKDGLEGVGSSRASLILSVAFPDSLPFFSRGLYRWTHWDERSGWAQDFKWTPDKYHSVLNHVSSLVESHSVDGNSIQAVDVEKVAFVLEHESCITGFQIDSIVDDLIDRTEITGHGRANVYKVDRSAIDGSQGVIALKQIYKTKDVTVARSRFLAEVTSSYHLSKLSPEHFVEFIGWNEDRNSLFIAMEYIELGDLEQCIGASRWVEKDIKETTRQILEGLDIMHREGIAHRDLKPQNILVVSMKPSNVKVKIADFGLSKRLSNRKTSVLATRGIGTAGYKAPEVVQQWYSEDSDQDQDHYSRHSYTFKADIWSVGCIIFRMVVGERTRLFRNDIELTNQPSLIKRVKCIKNLLEGADTPMGQDGIQFVQKLIVIEEEDRCDSESALKELGSWKIPT